MGDIPRCLINAVICINGSYLNFNTNIAKNKIY